MVFGAFFGTNERESALIKKAKELDDKDPIKKVVQHLTSCLTTKKNIKSIPKIRPTKFIDLETGEIGQIVKGKIQLEDSEPEGR